MADQRCGPAPCSEPPFAANAILVPSGDQVGLDASSDLPVRRSGFPSPLTFTTATEPPPLAWLMNAILVPSGDQAGSWLLAVASVSLVRPEPSGRMLHTAHFPF